MRCHDRGIFSRVASVVVSLAAVAACAVATPSFADQIPGANGYVGTGKAAGGSYLYGPTATLITPTISGAHYDTVGGVTVPLAASFVDTLVVARDFNDSGTVADAGTFPAGGTTDSERHKGGDFAIFDLLEIEYIGTGPDTLWVRMYDDKGNLIRETTKYTTTSAGLPGTVRNNWLLNYQFHKAAFYVGKASDGATWTIASYARHPRR